MTLVIMAAGMGSRFGGLKQIEPMDEYGNFIIDYSIYDAIRNGYDKVVFIIKKENYDIFRDTIGKRIENKIKVEYAFQEISDLPSGYECPKDRVKPWGTGHAILSARKVVNEPFTIINSDDFYGFDAYKKASDFIKSNSSNYAMTGYLVKNTITENGKVKRGVCNISDGYVTSLVESEIEYKDSIYTASPLNGSSSFVISPEQVVSMNMFTFTPKIFDFLEKEFPKFLDENIDNLKSEFLIPDLVFKEMREEGVKVQVLSTNAKWLGVTYREDKDIVVNSLKELVDNGEYKKGLW